MSGKLSVVDRSAPIAKHDRVVFDLDDGQQLRFNDIRKFGKMWVVVDPEEVTGAIGPEPLDRTFTLPKFRELVQSRSGTIKPLLLNQTFLAGVGNIYADESLWLAKIHPLRKSRQSNRTPRSPRCIDRSARCCAPAIEDEGTDAGDGVIEGDYHAARVWARGQAVLSLSSTDSQDRGRTARHAFLSAVSTQTTPRIQVRALKARSAMTFERFIPIVVIIGFAMLLVLIGVVLALRQRSKGPAAHEAVAGDKPAPEWVKGLAGSAGKTLTRTPGRQRASRCHPGPARSGIERVAGRSQRHAVPHLKDIHDDRAAGKVLEALSGLQRFAGTIPIVEPELKATADRLCGCLPRRRPPGY